MMILSLKFVRGYPQKKGSRFAIASDGAKRGKRAKWRCERGKRSATNPKENSNEKTIYIHSSDRSRGSFSDGCSDSEEGAEHVDREHGHDSDHEHAEGPQEEGEVQ
jgi:hypothetical protein